MDPKIIAQTMTANRNIQRLLKYLVLSHMIDNGVSQGNQGQNPRNYPK